MKENTKIKYVYFLVAMIIMGFVVVDSNTDEPSKRTLVVKEVKGKKLYAQDVDSGKGKVFDIQVSDLYHLECVCSGDTMWFYPVSMNDYDSKDTMVVPQNGHIKYILACGNSSQTTK